jgi:hypothetical protein
VPDPSVHDWVQYDLPSKSAQMPPEGQSAFLVQVLVHNPPCGAAPLMPRLPVSRHVSGPHAASDVHGRPSCAAPGTGPPLEEVVDVVLLDVVVVLLLDVVVVLLLDVVDDETCEDVAAPPAPPIPPVPEELFGAPQAVNNEDAALRRKTERRISAVVMRRKLSGFSGARKVHAPRKEERAKPMLAREFV